MAKKTSVRKPKKGERNITYMFRKVRDIFRKPSASPEAKDTSGKLKSVHGKAKKDRLKKGVNKKKQSKWQKEFYKDAPKGKVKRFFWRLHPKRQFKFWFSRHGLRTAFKFGMLGIASFFILLVGLYAYYSRELPPPEEISRRLIEQTTKFYDRTGQVLLYEVYGDENRTVVEFDEISDYAKQATIAIEDKNFYDHNGISISGIVRSAIQNFTSDTQVGGSTITQQFVKNSLLSREKTYERKIKEAILSLELERIYTKDEILGFYLNEVPYGGTSYGIQSAANNYFAKDSSELTIDEAAVLAAMIQRPTFFSPYGENTEELIARRDFVIDLMQEQGYITAEEAQASKETDTLAKVGSKGRELTDIKAPHFVLEAQRQLEDRYGSDTLAKGGLTVITTVDMKLQEAAEKAIADNIAAVDAIGGNNAALSATDPATGQVIAQVGSRDFTHPEFGTFNAALSRQQPGSSFKPYEYAKAMESNQGAGTIYYDLATDFGGNYKPKNFDGGFKGANTARAHLGGSRNIPAIKALYIAGIGNVIDQVEKQGVSINGDESNFGLALALGAADVLPAEHVHGFSVYANKGVYKEQTYILKVTNSIGEVLEEWQDSEGEQVVDPQIAYIISDMLADGPARAGIFAAPGSTRGNNLIVPGIQTAVKTGTTNDARDIWTVGYSTRIAAGVWVGHSENIPLRTGASSAVQPARIWDDFMTAAHDLSDYKDKTPDFERPDGIKTVTLDRITGRLPLEGSSNGTVTDIFPSWYKPAEAVSGDPFVIDTVSGKLATECTPELAKQEVRVGGVSAEIPASDPSYRRWNAPVQARYGGSGSGIASKPTSNDDVHSCSDAKPVVSIDNVSNSGNTYTVDVTVTKGKFPLTNLDYKVDGQIIAGGATGITSGGSYSKSFDLSEGNHTIEVVVTDEGLYQSSDNEKVTVAANNGNGNFAAISPDGGSNSGTVNFVWDPHPDADSYKVVWNHTSIPSLSGSQIVNNGNTHSESLLSGNYEWYVEAYEKNGAQDLLATSFTLAFTQN
ncbi:TPA: hypothetical protein EYO12_01690 [Candidatus Saccharibacteria bacterium]|nr:hypothetical protein [Candidatus Saccharibacteria bacterium]HIO87429.1 hypothetical protein [Candidatus Saccharibacteria bacterium]